MELKNRTSDDRVLESSGENTMNNMENTAQANGHRGVTPYDIMHMLVSVTEESISIGQEIMRSHKELTELCRYLYNRLQDTNKKYAKEKELHEATLARLYDLQHPEKGMIKNDAG